MTAFVICVSRMSDARFRVRCYGPSDATVEQRTKAGVAFKDLPPLNEIYDDVAQAEEFAWQWARFLNTAVYRDFDTEMGRGE